MKNIMTKSALAAGVIDRSGIVKALAASTVRLLPKDTKLPAATIEKLLGVAFQFTDAAASRLADQIATKLADQKLLDAVIRIADAVVLRAVDQIAGKLAGKLADSQAVNALAGKIADQIAEKFAARFADERFTGAVAAQFAEAFGNSLDGSVAVRQFQPKPAKGKRKS